MGVLGVTLGVAIWAAVALLGLNLLLAKMAWLRRSLLLAGLYLLWMGWQLLRSARHQHRHPPVSGVEPQLARRGHTFLRGLLTNLSNPKVVIYFGSIFPCSSGMMSPLSSGAGSTL